MKRIGIIGATVDSTMNYYESINCLVREHTGDLASAEMVLRSVNFREYYDLLEQGDQATIRLKLKEELGHLFFEHDCKHVAIASNILHSGMDIMAEQLFGNLPYNPFVHIGDCVAEQCAAAGVKRVTILGAREVMAGDFLKNHLEMNGLKVRNIFSGWEVEELNQMIFGKLYRGRKSFNECWQLIDLLNEKLSSPRNSNIEGIVLACNEFYDLIGISPESFENLSQKFGVQIFSSAQAHCEKLAELCTS